MVHAGIGFLLPIGVRPGLAARVRRGQQPGHLGFPAPQEALYRRFLLLRYQRLFGSGAGSVLTSAAAFGFAHIVYGNALAVGLSAAGGLLFAASYRRHRSLALVCLEHALYGCLVFTIGLGRFFYTGAAWRP